MGERILFGHSKSKSAGYRVLFRSGADSGLSELEINEIVQKLKLSPNLLKDRLAYYWLKASDSRRLFIRVHATQRDSGARLLEYRLICLSQSECDVIAWQPFQFESMFSDLNWDEVDNEENFQIPRQVEASPDDVNVRLETFDINWNVLDGMETKLLSKAIDCLPLRQRKDCEFYSPKTQISHQAKLTFEISSLEQESLSVARKPKKGWPVLWLIFGISLGAIPTALWLNQELQTVKQLARDREQLLTKMEAGKRVEDITSTGATVSFPNVEPLDFRAKQWHRNLSALFEEIDRIRYANIEDSRLQKLVFELRHYLKSEEKDYEKSFEIALVKWVQLEKKLSQSSDYTAPPEDDSVDPEEFSDSNIEIKRMLDWLRGEHMK